jgi:hypothetical protein
METIYEITTNEFGTILIRRRKIAKAFRWWLRDNGYNFTYSYYSVKANNKVAEQRDYSLEKSVI